MTMIQLPRRYDVERLQRDLEGLRSFDMARQPGPYHRGEWKGISLYAQGGRQGAHPGYAGLDPYLPTDALLQAPYLKEILDELRCPKRVVRVLSLPPGGRIEEHNDAWANFHCGTLRLHVPIVTDPEVEFVIDGERARWMAGELWYGDFSLPHHVVNRSSIHRVHLVIDVEINDFVISLFPKELIAAMQAQGDGVARHRAPLEQNPDTLADFACEVWLPAEVMPLFGGGRKLSSLSATTLCRIAAAGRRLVAALDGEPRFALERVADTAFNIVGLASGCSFEFARSHNQVVGVQLVLRGLPEDLYAAQLGFQQGPMIYVRRIPLALHRGSPSAPEGV